MEDTGAGVENAVGVFLEITGTIMLLAPPHVRRLCGARPARGLRTGYPWHQLRVLPTVTMYVCLLL